MGDTEGGKERRTDLHYKKREYCFTETDTQTHIHWKAKSPESCWACSVYVCECVLVWVCVVGYQMTCNPSCLSSMCFNTHIHKHNDPPYQNLCVCECVCVSVWARKKPRIVHCRNVLLGSDSTHAYTSLYHTHYLTFKLNNQHTDCMLTVLVLVFCTWTFELVQKFKYTFNPTTTQKPHVPFP